MDYESEMGGRPDNLLWVEDIILKHLETVIDPITQAEEILNTYKPIKHQQQQQQQQQQHNIQLLIAQIEMRDENYFGDDRMRTLSRIVTARIKYIVGEDNEERNHFWIIKIPSVLPQERELSSLFDAYQREICFYTEILPSIRLWVDSQDINELIEFNVPPCYYGKFLRPNDPIPDMELLDHILEAESLLVLEDLRASEFGKRYFGTGMEISEVFAAVEEITKFHAVSYAMQIKSKDSFHYKELLREVDFVRLYEALFHHGFEIFKNFLSNRPDEKKGAAILGVMTEVDYKAGAIFKALLAPSKGFPITLIHMDLWSDNLLFRVKEEEMEALPLEEANLDCVIIDWQMVSLGKPSHDLALLTTLSMDPEGRREHSLSILQFYYQLFFRTLALFEIEMPFGFEQLKIEFSNSCLLAVMMAICSMDVVLMEEAAQRRLIAAIEDLMLDGILNMNVKI